MEVRSLPDGIQKGLPLIIKKLVVLCKEDVAVRENDEEEDEGEATAEGSKKDKGKAEESEEEEEDDNAMQDAGEDEYANLLTKLQEARKKDNQEDEEGTDSEDDEDWIGGYLLLYDSPLEEVDEIVNLRDCLNVLA